MVTVAISIYFIDFIGSILFSSREYKYILLSLINILVINITDVARGVMIFEEKVALVNIVNIVGVLFSAIYGILSVVYFERGVTGVVEAGLAGSLSMCITSTLISLKKYKITFDRKILIKQIRFSFPLMLAVFAFLVIDSSDRYMLRLFLPLSEVGLYNLGFQVGMLVFLIVGGFSLAWPPYYHKNNQEGKAQELCGQTLNLFLCIAGLFVVLLCLFSPPLIKLMTPPNYHEIYLVTPFIALAIFMRGPYEIFIMGVVMKNKTSLQLYLEIFIAALNIILNYFLIKEIGREGAALSSMICYITMSLGAFIIVQKINPIPTIDLTKTLYSLVLIYTFSLSIFLKQYFSTEFSFIFMFYCFLSHVI